MAIGTGLWPRTHAGEQMWLGKSQHKCWRCHPGKDAGGDSPGGGAQTCQQKGRQPCTQRVGVLPRTLLSPLWGRGAAGWARCLP